MDDSVIDEMLAVSYRTKVGEQASAMIETCDTLVESLGLPSETMGEVYSTERRVALLEVACRLPLDEVDQYVSTYHALKHAYVSRQRRDGDHLPTKQVETALIRGALELHIGAQFSAAAKVLNTSWDQVTPPSDGSGTPGK